jgi:aspartate racemase
VHIGIIGGIGPAATDFYYRNLIKAHALANKKFDLTIVHAEVSDVIGNIAANTPDKQAKIFIQLAYRLEASGADVIAISSIAAHFCIAEFIALSPLPIISIIPTLESELKKRGLKKVGLLGHRISMETKLFGGISSVDVVIPLGDELDIAHNIYIKMAAEGQVDSIQRELLFTIDKKLCIEQGADAVILAGTDLCLAFDGYECGFNVIDSALVHINALCDMSG